jgi:hypothetical protein
MQPYKRTKRRKRDVMHWNDVEAAQFVTYEDVTVVNPAGTAQTKRVKVPLYPRETESGHTAAAGPAHNQADYDLHMADEVPITDRIPRKVQSWITLENAINFKSDAKRLYITICGED